MARPRVRERGGREVVLPSWERAVGEDWLGRWAVNLMLIGVTTRRFGRAVRLPEGDVPAGPGAGGARGAGLGCGVSWPAHARGSGGEEGELEGVAGGGVDVAGRAHHANELPIRALLRSVAARVTAGGLHRGRG